MLHRTSNRIGFSNAATSVALRQQYCLRTSDNCNVYQSQNNLFMHDPGLIKIRINELCFTVSTGAKLKKKKNHFDIVLWPQGDPLILTSSMFSYYYCNFFKRLSTALLLSKTTIKSFIFFHLKHIKSVNILL